MTGLRRRIAIVALIFGIIAVLAGCHRLVEPENPSISVCASFWPVYALTDAVMADVPDATLGLMAQPQDGCLRDYAISDWDAAMLARADAVILGGRGLESFESALFSLGDSGPAVSAVLYNLELYRSDRPADGESESHLNGPNPHLYLSLDGAKQIVDSICATMQSLDPAYAQAYIQNAQRAAERLDRLLADNRALLADFADRKVVLMNEALIYPALDYGLEVADWIDRESGTGLYDRELEQCLERLKAADARVILIERQAPQALTEALEAAGFAVARLDVFSAHRQGEGFDIYLERQSANAQAIYDAFTRADSMEAAH